MVKFKIKDSNIDRDGEIRIVNESGWETWAKPEEIMTETNKVELTKEQAEFLESFTYKPKALHYISRVGWDYAFTDNEEKEIDFETPRYKELLGNLEDGDELKMLLLKALINGYTVKHPKLYTVEIPNPKVIGNEHLVLLKNGFGDVVIVKAFGDGWKKEKGHQLTEKEIRKDFEWAWQWAEPVEV